MLRYFGRILAMPASRLPRRVYEMLRAEGRRRSWTGVVERLAREWGYVEVWDTQRLPESDAADEGDAWRDALKERAKLRALQNHRAQLAANPSIISRNYAAWSHVSEFDTQMRMADYVSNAGVHDAGVARMFALRSGTSNLLVDQGRRRRPRIPRERRLCPRCDLRAIEDARHVVVDCPAHAQARRTLVATLPQPLRNLQDQRVFNALMGSAHLVTACADDEPLRLSVTESVNAFWAHVEQRRACDEALAPNAATT